jgi:outer membrane protein TolC
MSEQARAGVAVQESKLQPQAYGFAQYNLDPENSLLTDPDWAVGIGLRYKFFSGLDRGQATEAAQHLASQATAGEREVRTQIEIGVTRAWFEVEAARKRFLLLENSLASSEENLRLQTLAFHEQQATSLDVIDAQLSIGRSRIQRAQAAYDYVLALAQLLNVSGQMIRMPDYLSRADRIVP